MVKRQAAGARLGPGSVAVVTGAAGGLGKALVKALEGRGARVVGADLQGAERELDVRDSSAIQALAEEIEADIWVNNAGILGNGEAVSQDRVSIENLVAVNLMGVIYGTQAAAKVMTGRGSGTILNIGSLSSWNPTPGLAVYAATKHAVRAYSGAVATELESTGIRVCCLCPDGIATPMLGAVVGDPTAVMPFTGRRLLEPAEVAEAGMRLIESGKLVRSLPAGRATQAKISGLWPGLAMRMGRSMVRQGVKGQAKAAERMEEMGSIR